MNPSDVPFEGLKIQLKGRMSGKGGKASKKVWVWGRTGRKAVEDPVDYAHEAVVTRAGYIGIKVRLDSSLVTGSTGFARRCGCGAAQAKQEGVGMGAHRQKGSGGPCGLYT